MLNKALETIRIVGDTLPDDDPDKIEMMDIEGDYSQLMNWALIKFAEAKADEAAAKELEAKYKARKEMFKRSQDNMRRVVSLLMDAASENKFKSEVATVSLRDGKDKVVIDEDKLDKRFITMQPKVEKALINDALKAGEEIQGVSTQAGDKVLTIKI